MSRYYILDGDQIRGTDDLLEWSRWCETASRQIAFDEIASTRISTVFLGIDYGFGEGEPILFETMIFGGAENGYQERYTIKELALAGHRDAVKRVRESMN